MTSIYLPTLVPFPVTVSAILCGAGDTVGKHAPLIKYKYWDYQDDPKSTEATPQKVRVERIGSFESPIEGNVAHVNVHLYDEIAHSGVELFTIQERCTHTVQYGGLCALCGKAVEDEKDYTGYNFEDRATISMSHDSTGLRISLDEATKIERTAREKLAQEKKLILVVDLDQTVIHATVDPTVGEWQRDTSSPNYPYVKDVRSFALEEEPVQPPGWMGARPPPTKCWYYVKLRPKLEEFLAQVSKLYELHIYTMATRNYALAIANIIDPTGQYFGDRILSRDESGLLTHKNLKRLFPVDQSMVVIIDDRGDVWQWESNLIKVVPYDFFVGIGDINLSFLPKKNGQLLGPTKHRKTIARLAEMEEQSEKAKEKQVSSEGSEGTPMDSATVEEEKVKEENLEESSGGDHASPVERMVSLGGGENNTNLLHEQLLTRSQLVEQQQHERPLAKLQHNLDKIIHDHDTPTPESEGDEAGEENLLHDDDTELASLENALTNIHKKYFEVYNAREKGSNIPRPDLTTIIPELKRHCLEGVVILFSGILPLGMNIANADIVIWCRQFGVKVVNEVFPDVTHVVCRDPASSFMRPGLTLKVRVAKKTIPNVKIVSPDWLFSCLSQWRKVQEDDYIIDLPEQDWFVSNKDVTKYQKALNLQSQREQDRGIVLSRRPREDSLSSIEEYDFNDANAEVDDFLAGLSDEDEIDNDEDEDEDELRTESAPQGSAFLKGLYNGSRSKRTQEELSEDEDGSYKKQRTGEDIDELEKELLDELDSLDE